MTFPSHQGLILPVARKWPHAFDALALSVGAAMPDITDTILGFSLNGYFKHSYGHSLLGTVTFDLAGGLFLTWCLAIVIRRVSKLANAPRYIQAFLPKAPPTSAGNRQTVFQKANPLRLWSFSILVGILSHIGFDLISHTTNLLFYPWSENVHLFPQWWYITWFEIPALSVFGRTYSVGVFTILWIILTVLGILLFLQFLRQPGNEKKELSAPMPSNEDHTNEFNET